MKVIDKNGRAVEMTGREVVEGYLAAEKPYEVCVHTVMGGYMEFITLERGIMFEDNAKMVADQYAEMWPNRPDYKGICVRKYCKIVYETNCKKEAK